MKKVREKGGRPRDSVPGKSESHTYAERNVQDVEYGSAATMETAWAPIGVWSYASRTLDYNRARKKHADGTDSPYKQEWGSDFTGLLLPFGCRVKYLDTEADKMEPKSKEGIFLTYASSGALEIMDTNDFKEERKYTLRKTKDFQAFPEKFPFRDILTEAERKENKETYNVMFMTESETANDPLQLPPPHQVTANAWSA